MIKERELICPRCGKKFTIQCTDRNFEKGRYPHYCSRSCANIRILDESTKQKISDSIIRYRQLHVSDAKYNLTTYYCKQCGKAFDKHTIRNTKGHLYCSKECSDAWMKENLYPKSGGYREGSGRGKHGWYKGYKCDSTYELAYLIYNIDHNIPIQRCEESFVYEYDGKQHEYHPDFIVDNTIIEIKGYHTDLVDIKLRAVNRPIKILYKKDIQYCIDYVVGKYNVTKYNIHNLYDDYKPQYTYICDYCGKEFVREKEIKTPHKFCSRSCCGKYSF